MAFTNMEVNELTGKFGLKYDVATSGGGGAAVGSTSDNLIGYTRFDIHSPFVAGDPDATPPVADIQAQAVPHTAYEYWVSTIPTNAKYPQAPVGTKWHCYGVNTGVVYPAISTTDIIGNTVNIPAKEIPGVAVATYGLYIKTDVSTIILAYGLSPAGIV